MAVEIFTQLTATGDQLPQQYQLRKRFCIDHLGWDDRNVHFNMEYDEFDHPFSIYLVWRDESNVARGMARFSPCSQPFMIEKAWPHLVADCDMPKRDDQWEVTRLCIEPELGKRKGLVIGEMFQAAELLANRLGINEYWWVSPKERINVILPHNHKYVGPGQQIGAEFCFVGYSDPTQMVMPALREHVADAPEPLMRVAA